MPAVFVHVSDIHFGQEKDDSVHIHNDVKQCVIDDAAEVVKSLVPGVAHGILATGDIAFSGKQPQYDEAAKWLDDLAKAVGCEIFQIQMVPGNHDLDRDRLSLTGKYVLDIIRQGGIGQYEQVLSDSTDRSTLYARFADYIKFCEGYDCALDTEGRYSSNLHVELSPGRSIRFVRINSSLLCTGDERDDDPELIIGARQFTVRRQQGEEVVALIHHPLNWFKDSEDATRYLKSRVRVLISGHEHNPRVSVDAVEEGADVMMLAAGATVPFKSNDEYTFTYNIIEFDWDEAQDALAVTIHPRAWDSKRTKFIADDKRLGGKNPKFVLASPNFRTGSAAAGEATIPSDSVHEPVVEIVPALDTNEVRPVEHEDPDYRITLLRFFRDLTEAQRLRVLAELGALDTGVQAVIQKTASAFLAEDRPLEIGLVAGAAAIQILSPTPGNGGWTIADVYAAALWLALSFQPALEEPKREALRLAVLNAARERSELGAEAARVRTQVPEATDSVVTAADDGKTTIPFKKAVSPSIEALRRNAALDREEIDYLWWAMLNRSRLLNRPFSQIPEPARLVTAGIEAAGRLRRLPCEVQKELVLRTIDQNPFLDLAELLQAIGDDRDILVGPVNDTWVHAAPAVFPLLHALVISGELWQKAVAESEISSDWMTELKNADGAILFVRVGSGLEVRPLDWVTSGRLLKKIGQHDSDRDKLPTQVMLCELVRYLEETMVKRQNGKVPRLAVVAGIAP